LVGAALNSTELTFRSGQAEAGEYSPRCFLPQSIGRERRSTQVFNAMNFCRVAGGEWTVWIQPSQLHGFELHHRGRLQPRRVRALVSNLPVSIAQREVKMIAETLPWAARTEVVDARAPGNIVMISAEYANVSELATGFGQRAVPELQRPLYEFRFVLHHSTNPAHPHQRWSDRKVPAPKFRIEPESSGVWRISL